VSSALRLAWWLVGALLAVALFHAVVINVFLSTGLFARIVDRQPDVIDVHFSRGWSLIPGHIHAKNLSIRGRDGNIEWILRLDDVEFDVSFRALASQRFEASHVHGRGISFRLRQRLAAPPNSPDEVANLPPIEGLGPYAVRPPPGPDLQKWSDEAYHLWTGHLEDVVAEGVREVWIDDAHFEGSARIAGRFYFKPVRLADVGPIQIDVHEGHVRMGASVVVERLAGATADVTVVPFDPRTVEGMNLLRQISFAATMHPVCPEIGRLPLPIPEGMGITGEVDVSRLVLGLRGGTLQEGTKVDAMSPRATVTRGEHRFTGVLAVVGAVMPVDGRRRLDLRAQVTDLDVVRTSAPRSPVGAFLHVPRATITGDSRALDLADALADLHLIVDVEGAELPDVSALSAYIPGSTPLALNGGRGRASAHLETWRDEKRATARANLRVDDLGLRLGRMRIQGKASADASFGSFPWETSIMKDVELSLRVASATLASEQTPAIPLVRVGDLRVDTRAAELVLDDPLRALRATIVLDKGEIVDPDLLRAYLPKGSEMHVLSGRAHFSLACELTLANHLAKGTLDVSSHRFGFSFRDFHVDVDLRAKARVHDWQWERGDLALDHADVDVTHVSVYRSGKEQDDRPVRSACAGCSPAISGAGALPVLSFARIVLGAKSRHFTFVDPLAGIAVSAFLLDARVHDSAVVNAFLPTGAPFLIRANEGSFSSDIEAQIQRHILQGTIALRANRMGIGGKSFHIEGDVDVLARVSDWDFAKSTLGVQDARVVFSHVTGGFHGAATDGSFAGVASALAPGKPTRPDFRAEQVVLSASTPTLDLVKPSLRYIDGRVAIVGGELPDAKVLARSCPPTQSCRSSLAARACPGTSRCRRPSARRTGGSTWIWRTPASGSTRRTSPEISSCGCASWDMTLTRSSSIFRAPASRCAMSK
jgi:hypothetical protein